MPQTHAEDEADLRRTTALEWFVRLQDASATEGDRRGFEAWRSADPANAVAFADAKALWDRFEGVSGHAAGRRGLGIDRRKLLLGGAALGLAGGGSAFVVGRPDLFADIRTGIGERRVVALPGDGRIELGSDSALSRAPGPDGETLLLYRGEGLFAAPPGHPFTVVADRIRTRLHGAVCDVKCLVDAVIVSVESGTARVDAPRFAPLTVEAGWQAVCRSGDAPVLARADLAAVTAWRHDRLVFRDTPLPRVVAELERYRRGRILLLGEGLGALTVTAAFDARRADTALDALGDILPIRLTRLTGLLTVIRPL